MVVSTALTKHALIFKQCISVFGLAVIRDH